MIAIDRLGVEMPPVRAGPRARELMGGSSARFDVHELHVPVVHCGAVGRPFYDLIANIAAEEFGHIELVAAAINTMLPTPKGRRRQGTKAALAVANA